MRQFRKKFYQVTIPIALKNQLDLIKSAAVPSKGFPVSYAEQIWYLIENLPSQKVEVQPSSKLPIKDVTTESHLEYKESDSTYEETTTESSFDTIEDETEFKEDN